MIKAIIFDFDHTLEDFTSAERSGEIKLGDRIEKEFNIKKDTFLNEFYQYKKKFLKRKRKPMYYSRRLWIKKTFSSLKVRVGDSKINNLERFFWIETTSKISLYKNTRRILALLKNKFKLAILTDSDGKRKFKLMRIKKLGIKKYFDAIITTDQVKANKPDRKCFLFTAEKLRVKPKECIMIGDHPETDLIGAKGVGMKTIWLMKGPFSKKNNNYAYVDYKAHNSLEVYKRIMSIYYTELNK